MLFEEDLRGLIVCILPVVRRRSSSLRLTQPSIGNQHRLITTMKLAILSVAIAGAAAFAPVQQQQASTALNASPFENDIGATLPIGFYDPLGLVADGDQANFDRLRLTELKHGRISMLAVVGYLAQEAGLRWPGDIDIHGHAFADIPNGYAALEAIPYFGNIQIICLIGALEVFVMRDFTGGEFPGDLRNGLTDFGWDTFDERTKLRKRSIELNNGRAAMMGILGLMVHEQLGVSILPSQIDSAYV